MIQRIATGMFALAGFAPAGTLRRVAAVAILSVSASWVAYGQTQEEPAAQSQAAPVFSVLYTFTGGTDGGYPSAPAAPLTLDRLGNLYGTTPGGGDLSCGGGFGCGVVFKVDQTGTETVLYAFTGAVDGGGPYASVLRDPAGNLYGTTPFGGSSGGAGTVFKLTPAGTESVLYGFSGGADGNGPYAGVVRDEAGNLYGTAAAGGAGPLCPNNCGVMFKVDRSGKETVLHSFAGGPTDGSFPEANLLRDKAGNLYGTTASGGTSTSAGGCFGSGCGVVFKLDSSGKETVLYNFTGGADGAGPTGWLIADKEGNLYGTATSGGHLAATCFVLPGCGVVFKLDPTGKETVLHAFAGGTEGGMPEGGLVRDAAGNLYGATLFGGDVSCGCGVVYKLDPSGKETVLHAFTGLADGAAPETGLVSNAGVPDCNRYELYGTTSGAGTFGGTFGAGVVFRLTLPQASEPDPN